MGHRIEAQREQLASRIARTTGQELLFLLAIAFVFGFGTWWYQAWATLINPPRLLSAPGIFTVMISAVYALVLPLFLSMLLPSSPAGWLLQQQTWAYPGQIAVLVASIVLGYFGGQTMCVWLLSQGPGITETGMFGPALVAALVGAYLVPALQFAYMTPAQQLIRIQQAHEIKKLKILHGGELAVLETRLIWLKQKAAASCANLLPGEQREVLETQRALFKSIADSQRRICMTAGVSREVMASMGLLEDSEVEERMRYTEQVLIGPADAGDDLVAQIDRHIAELPEQEVIEFQPASSSVKLERRGERGAQQNALPVEAPPRRDTPLDQLEHKIARGAHQDAAPATSPPRPAPDAAPPRPAAPRRAPPRYAAELAQARKVLSGTWTARELGDAMSKSERTARDWIAVWEESGEVARGETKGCFYFTESEAEHER